MRKNYKAVIFDLDGVICHTDKYHYLSWKEVAKELGIELDRGFNEKLRGMGRRETLEALLTRYPGKLTDAEKNYFTEKKNNIYLKLLDNMNSSNISLEVRETLAALRESGIKLAIGSSSKNAKHILEKLELKNYFDAVSDGTDITRSKPDPEVFLKACRYLNMEPTQCLVVEDAKAGIEAAAAGGMDCAAIGQVNELKLATYSLNCFSDLINIVLTK